MQQVLLTTHYLDTCCYRQLYRATYSYGNKFPVTTEGRIIAALLMTVGVGLFRTFTAYLASWFVGEGKKEQEKKNGGGLNDI